MLGSVSLMSLLVLPVMLGSFVDHLGHSERDAGLLASAVFLGTSLAALVLAFRIHHMNLRRLACTGLVLMLLADGLSTGAAAWSLPVLVLLRFTVGAANAAVYGSVMAVFAQQREPGRGYGLFMAMQFAVSGVGLFGLPLLMPRLETGGLFALFAVLDALALLLLRFMPPAGERRARLPGGRLEWQIILTVTAITCMLAYGLFETTQMAQFAYTERIALSKGLTAAQVGQALGLASLLGIPGAFAVTWLGSRFGYFRPIAVAAVIQMGMMTWLIHAQSFSEYLVIICVFSMGWAFVLPYFQAIEARIDPGGSVVLAGSFATGMAGFAGPAAAALVVRPGDYSLLLWGVVAGLGVVVLLTRFVTLRLAMDMQREV